MKEEWVTHEAAIKWLVSEYELSEGAAKAALTCALDSDNVQIMVQVGISPLC